MTWGTLAYLFAGQLLGGAAAAAIILALIGDRLRGNHTRRRCPKCWFDLSATPGLTCPECGKTAKGERKLFVSRRRWGIAALGLLAMVTALVASLWPSWRRGEWFAFLPPSFQLELWPYTDKPNESFAAALQALEGDKLKARAMEVGLEGLVDATAPATAGPQMPPSQAAAFMAFRAGPPTGAILGMNYGHWPLSERAEAALKILLTEPSRGLQEHALQMVQYRSNLPESLREIVYAFATDATASANVRWAAIGATGVSGIEDVRGRTILATLLTQQIDSRARDPIAEWLLRASRFHTGELIEAYMNGTPQVQASIARAAAGQVDGYVAVKLFPLLLDQYLFGEPGELTEAASLALDKAGAMLDPLIVTALDDARGAALGRLLALTLTRDAHNALVAEALERHAHDPSRAPDEVEQLNSMATSLRKRLTDRVSQRTAEDAPKDADSDANTSPDGP